MPKSFVLFDCDGVLVDSEYLASHVLAYMLHQYGSPTSAEEIMTDYVGQKDVEIIRQLVNIHSLQLPNDFIKQYATRLDERLEQDLKPINGISEVLKHLKLPRAIVSNSTLARIETSLKSTGLDGYFSQSRLFSPDITAFSKPDPRIYQYAINQLDLSKEQVIVVEDSPTGVLAASSAGLDVIGFLGATHLNQGQEEKLRVNGAKYIAHNSTELSILFSEICG